MRVPRCFCGSAGLSTTMCRTVRARPACPATTALPASPERCSASSTVRPIRSCQLPRSAGDDSARAGSSLAGGLAELADDVRRRAHDDATAAAERAGVAISGPLGLCFLPAFLCLGVVPLVLGIAEDVLG